MEPNRTKPQNFICMQLQVLPMELRFLLAFYVFVLFASLLLAQEQNQLRKSNCPKDFQCRNLGRLNFPFANSSQPDCGLCLIDCDDHSVPYPKIKLNRSSDQTFYATSMTNNSMKLIDIQLEKFLGNQSCNTYYYEISLPNSSYASFRIVSNTTTLFRCTDLSQEVAGQFYLHGYRKNTSCEGFEIFYRNPKYHPSHAQLNPDGCSAIQLPMSSWNNVTEEAGLFDLLTPEFDLEWKMKDSGNDKYAEIILGLVASAGGVALLVVFICSVRMKSSRFKSINFWNRQTEEDRNVETFLKNCGPLSAKRYHYSDVKKMTTAFRIKLGQGGYGSVYKGKLKDGSPVAVKFLKESKRKGEEFINEVASISKTSHVNIVTLLGFCVEGSKKALIYEFMPNGSLEKFIYGRNAVINRLEWQTLFKISIGIARGLEYLHRGCNTRILHFDIKPHNILLDENFCPKISDFGLSKLCTRKESMLSTMSARGTIGYIAPELICKNIGGVSHKSDVYSYGMMVLEMVGGRKNIHVGFDDTSDVYFPHWIYTRLDQDEELGLSGITNEEENKQARKMLMVSLWCIQTDPSSRPSMTNVVEMLEGNLEALQMPPKPFLSSPTRESSDSSSINTVSFCSDHWKATV